MSLTTTVTENGTLSTNGRFYEKPRNRPEGEGAARYPEGNPRPNTQSSTPHFTGPVRFSCHSADQS